MYAKYALASRIKYRYRDFSRVFGPLLLGEQVAVAPKSFAIVMVRWQ
jgi:hypothetical protein